MLGRLRGLIAASVALTLFVAVLLAGGTDARGARPERKVTLLGTAGPVGAVAVQQWAALEAGNIAVTLKRISEAEAVEQFVDQKIDFAGLDASFDPDSASISPTPGTYQEAPLVGFGECLVYNLKVAGGKQVHVLRLDSSLVMGMFSGRMTSWQNQRIRDLNPGVTFPRKPITVVYDSEPSGDSFVLSDYLSTTQKTSWSAFTKALGERRWPRWTWPVLHHGGSIGRYDFSHFVAAADSGAVRKDVEERNGAIAVVWDSSSHCAEVENASGHFSSPTAKDVTTALRSARPSGLIEQLAPVFRNHEPAAYPLSAWSYLLIPTGQIGRAAGRMLGNFIDFVACDGQMGLRVLGYARLPPNLVAEALGAARAIHGGAALPRTCPPS